MGNLTQKDIKLLARMPISQGQRELVEECWDNSEPNKVRFRYSSLLRLVPLIIVATFVSAYFVEGVRPFVNVALVVLWLLMISTTLSYVIILGVTLSFALSSDTKRNKLLLRRQFMKYLASRNLAIQGYYVAQWIALVFLAAMLGHLVTSVFAALAWGFTGLATWSVRKLLKKNLEDVVKKVRLEEIRRRVVKLNN